jgi:hypothetical protein
MPYPDFIIEKFHDLNYLCDRPWTHELDERGCFSAESCKQVDKDMLKWAEPQLAEFFMPTEIGHGSNPNSKWRIQSCLQKAIRGGDVEMSMFAVSALFDVDAYAARKRIAVIALEDCGMANLPMVMVTLAQMGDPHWRKAVDERRLLIWMAKELAAGCKDRTAVEALVAPHLVLKPELIADMAKMVNDDLKPFVIDPNSMNDDYVVVAAAAAMAGTKKFEVPGMPDTNDRPPTGLFKAMVETGMSRAMLYVAAKAASRLQDSMFISTILMDRWARYGFINGFVEEPLTKERPKVGKLLGASYDKHTREGQAATAKFFRECGPLAPFVLSTPPEMRKELMGRGVFMSEGGLLDWRMDYGESEQVRAICHDETMRFSWLPENLCGKLIMTIRDNIEQLNECRSKVLYAKQQG